MEENRWKLFGYEVSYVIFIKIISICLSILALNLEGEEPLVFILQVF